MSSFPLFLIVSYVVWRISWSLKSEVVYLFWFPIAISMNCLTTLSSPVLRQTYFLAAVSVILCRLSYTHLHENCLGSVCHLPSSVLGIRYNAQTKADVVPSLRVSWGVKETQSANLWLYPFLGMVTIPDSPEPRAIPYVRAHLGRKHRTPTYLALTPMDPMHSCGQEQGSNTVLYFPSLIKLRL